MPRDPVDPFRGRYAALRLEGDGRLVPNPDLFRAGQKAYAQIQEHENGFATLGSLSAGPPADGPYLAVRLERDSNGHLVIRMPFTRYFMNEVRAPEVDAALRNAPRTDGRQAPHLVVRVREGNATPQDLVVGTNGSGP